MSSNTALVCLAFIAATFGGAAIISENWAKAEHENNEFAKECNARGGVAYFDYDARQCIGAEVALPAQDDHSKSADGAVGGAE